MKTLSLGNITRTISLLSAGALLGVFLLAPLSAGASDDDDEPNISGKETPAVFVLQSTNGQSFTFQLIENGGGELEFTHVPPAPQVFDVDDNDDD